MTLSKPPVTYGLSLAFIPQTTTLTLLCSPTKPALTHLHQAIQLNPDRYRTLAQTDRDLDSLRQDPRFQALLQENHQISTDKS